MIPVSPMSHRRQFSGSTWPCFNAGFIF